MYQDLTIFFESIPNFSATSTTHKEGHVHGLAEFIMKEQKDISNINLTNITYEDETR